MKRVWIGIFLAGVVLIVGCQSASTTNTENTTHENVALQEVQAASGVAVDTPPWKQERIGNTCELFESSKIQLDGTVMNLENGQAKAHLELIDGNVILHYQSESGTIDNTILEWSTMTLETLAMTKFYELDIDADGQKELLISYTQGKGTGNHFGNLCVYDFVQQTMTTLFEGNTFTAKQKQEIYAQFQQWNQNDFEQETGVHVESPDDITSSYFKPMVIEYQGDYKIQVIFVLPGTGESGRVRYENRKSFVAWFTMRDAQFQLDAMWME